MWAPRSALLLVQNAVWRKEHTMIKNMKFEEYSKLENLLARVPEDWDWTKREKWSQFIGNEEFQVVVWEYDTGTYGFRVTHYCDEGSSLRSGKIVYGGAEYYLADELFFIESAEVDSIEEKVMAAIMPLLREDIESFLKAKKRLHSL